MAPEHRPAGPLIPIGRFSKISRLSVSSLRYYDELGLLRPAHVDPDSSYRYYLLSQVRTAETIRLLRALDMPLEDVQRFVADSDADQARDLLNLHERRMEERIAEGQRILAYLRRLQGGEGEDEIPQVQARDLPQQEILAIHARVPETAVPGTWRELAVELRAYVRRSDALSTQPVGAIFPDPFHDERAVNMTVFVPSPAGVRGQGRIVSETLPGGPCAAIRHLGPYALLHRSYEHLAAWMQRHGHETSGAPREIYLVGPADTTDPRNYETDVIWPIR